MSRRPVPTRLLALAAIVVAAACGGGDDGGDEASCVPSGPKLKVEAKSLEFDEACLAAPADTPFTIELENRDTVPHDMAIKRDPKAADDLFRGETLTKRGRITYQVPALAAGTYYFYCSVHPAQMNGRFLVA